MADVDRTGRDELHRAALKDDVRKVRERLESGVAADLGDTAGWTPLHFAAQDGSLAAAKVLLDAGANPNTRNNDGQTPL
ncbi:MAG TPA: ankyrin repeat domain-containing protein [Actinomadura sp.]|nr:ankyrin repeat domain-containing protein [Actinomadura sp.]